MKNWFGIESHHTDDYIHWTDNKPEETAKLLRHAYDSIHRAGLGDELKLLTRLAYKQAEDEAAEINAGASM